MNCQHTRKLMSDKADFLLPQKEERQFSTHLGECPLCDMDMKAMLRAKPLLKELYPSVKAPLGLRASVMEEIISQKGYFAPFALPLWLGKMLRPVAAIALSAAFLFGILALNRDLSDLRMVPEEERQVYENGATSDTPVKLVESDIEEDNHFAQADERLVKVGPKTQDAPPVAHTDEGTLTIKEPPVNEEKLVSDVAIVNIPIKQDEPVVIDKPADKPPSAAASDADIKTVELVSTPVSLEAANNGLITFSEDDIPDPCIFIRRKRIIEAVSLNVSVQRMDKALSQIENHAQFFRLEPDMSVTEIRENGTIVVMKSFIVPAGMADFFATQLSISGSITNRTKSSLNVTSDYSQMLDEHKELLDEVLNSGTGVERLKSHVALLMLLDKRSQPGVENVVLWLEDSVDF